MSQPPKRVNCLPIMTNLKIELGSAVRARVANGTNQVLCGNMLAYRDLDGAQVSREAVIPTAVVDDDDIAIALEPVGIHHFSLGDGLNGGTGFGLEMEPTTGESGSAARALELPEAKSNGPDDGPG